jgi:hypothetical protein
MSQQSIQDAHNSCANDCVKAIIQMDPRFAPISQGEWSAECHRVHHNVFLVSDEQRSLDHVPSRLDVLESVIWTALFKTQAAKNPGFLGICMCIRNCATADVSEAVFENDGVQVVMVHNPLNPEVAEAKKFCDFTFTLEDSRNKCALEHSGLRRSVNLTHREMSRVASIMGDPNITIDKNNQLTPCVPAMTAGVYRVPIECVGLLQSLFVMCKRKVWLFSNVSGWKSASSPVSEKLRLRYNHHIENMIKFVYAVEISDLFIRRMSAMQMNT